MTSSRFWKQVGAGSGLKSSTVLILLSATLSASHGAEAQFRQQRPKLVGTGVVLNGYGVAQGSSVAISGDGNTAIVGGLADNANVGAVWAYLRLPVLRCGDAHRRDLRSRPTDSRATHVASCGMSTGVGCINTTSALRRPPPIADGFALRRKNRTSRPLRHHRIHPRIIAIPHRCMYVMSAADPSAGRRHRDHLRPIKSP